MNFNYGSISTVTTSDHKRSVYQQQRKVEEPFENSAGHLPHKLYSNVMKPVALPPGRDRLLTRPDPTGSAKFANTIGTVRVAYSNGPMVELPL